jgi:hypothetical protein
MERYICMTGRAVVPCVSVRARLCAHGCVCVHVCVCVPTTLLSGARALPRSPCLALRHSHPHFFSYLLSLSHTLLYPLLYLFLFYLWAVYPAGGYPGQSMNGY